MKDLDEVIIDMINERKYYSERTEKFTDIVNGDIEKRTIKRIF